MRRTVTGFVLGYHGCDRSIAEKLLAGSPFEASTNNYDWLGAGAYFWENDPLRAMRWAEKLRDRPGKNGKIKDPTVVGAVIDLGLCLDLTTQSSLDVIRAAYDGLVTVSEVAKQALPENIDDLRRPLDCAEHAHRHGVFGKLHSSKNVRQTGFVSIFVVDEDIDVAKFLQR